MQKTSHVQITKAEAIEIFGSKEALIVALGNGEHSIGRWPDPLTERLTQRVIGAAFIYGKLKQAKKVARLKWSTKFLMFIQQGVKQINKVLGDTWQT